MCLDAGIVCKHQHLAVSSIQLFEELYRGLYVCLVIEPTDKPVLGQRPEDVEPLFGEERRCRDAASARRSCPHPSGTLYCRLVFCEYGISLFCIVPGSPPGFF